MSASTPDTDSAAELSAIAERLRASCARFDPLTLPEPVLLNSLFKSGTHLLRNILVHFFPGPQIAWQFLFDDLGPAVQRLDRGDAARFFVGHLAFQPELLPAIRRFRQVVLVRDPATWVLAIAREAYQADQQTPLARWMQAHRLPIQDWVELLIVGGRVESQQIEPALQAYLHRVLPWLSHAACVVRFEELLARCADLDSSRSEEYFARLLGTLRLELPGDWRARVAAGAQRKLSATSSDRFMRPELDQRRLTSAQLDLLECAAPGLRKKLGYGPVEEGLAGVPQLSPCSEQSPAPLSK